MEAFEQQRTINKAYIGEMANPEVSKVVQNGLFTNPFTVSTGVRIPLGTPINSKRYDLPVRIYRCAAAALPRNLCVAAGVRLRPGSGSTLFLLPVANMGCDA